MHRSILTCITLLVFTLSIRAQHPVDRYFGYHWGYFHQPTDSTPATLVNFFNSDSILFEKIPHNCNKNHSYIKLNPLDSTFSIYSYFEVSIPDTGQAVIDTIGFYGTTNTSEGVWLHENSRFGFKQNGQKVYSSFVTEDIVDPNHKPRIYWTSTGDYRTHFRLIRVKD